jgi:hypothetical protein
VLRRVLSAYASSMICLRLSAIVISLVSRIRRAAAVLLIEVKSGGLSRHKLFARTSLQERHETATSDRVPQRQEQLLVGFGTDPYKPAPAKCEGRPLQRLRSRCFIAGAELARHAQPRGGRPFAPPAAASANGSRGVRAAERPVPAGASRGELLHRVAPLRGKRAGREHPVQRIMSIQAPTATSW